MTHRIVSTDTPNFGVQRCKIAAVVPETTGLSRATWRVVLGIEKEHQPAALHGFGRALISVLILNTEVG